MKPLVLSALALLAVPALVRAEAKKPNIVLLLADDLGVGNVGCYGADRAKTPNIDALAAGGTRYTHAYTAPLCGPSRALIMSEAPSATNSPVSLRIFRIFGLTSMK